MKTTDFIGNFVYVDGIPAWNNFDEGRVVYQPSGAYFYENYIKDHLGSVRVTYSKSGTTTNVRDVFSYYPFGMTINSLTATSVTARETRNEYLYNGKMFQDELGLNWLDYGARFHDAVVGRWWSVDPLAEQSRRWSPYNYCVDNPMRFIDPDGMNAIIPSDPPLLWATKGAENAGKIADKPVRSIIASTVNTPLLVTTGLVMPIIGVIIDGNNGDFEGYPSWANPITVSNDLTSIRHRTEMMGENIPFESGMELLGATFSVAKPPLSENTIIDGAIGMGIEKVVNAIPDLVKKGRNDKSETQKSTDNDDNSSEKNIHMQYMQELLFKPGEQEIAPK